MALVGGSQQPGQEDLLRRLQAAHDRLQSPFQPETPAVSDFEQPAQGAMFQIPQDRSQTTEPQMPTREATDLPGGQSYQELQWQQRQKQQPSPFQMPTASANMMEPHRPVRPFEFAGQPGRGPVEAYLGTEMAIDDQVVDSALEGVEDPLERKAIEDSVRAGLMLRPDLLDLVPGLGFLPVAGMARFWHGGPHRILPEPDAPLGRFKHEYIGTGEGAQVFGHGLYFAGNKEVGKVYRRDISKQHLVREFRENLPDDALFDEVEELLDDNVFPDDMAEVLQALREDDWLGFDYPSQAIEAAFSGAGSFDMSPKLKKSIDRFGYLYEVDIPDEELDLMLDWDTPLTEQPQINEAIWRTMGDPEIVFARLGLPPNAKGADLLLNLSGGRRFGNALNPGRKAKEAAQVLKDAGIPGIRYFDQLSRTSPKAEALVHAQGSREAALDLAKKRLGQVQFGDYQGREHWTEMVEELQRDQTQNVVLFRDIDVEKVHD